MNSTVKLTFRNTATFFGVHVTSTPLDLSYSRLRVASGTVSYSKLPILQSFFFFSTIKFRSKFPDLGNFGFADKEVLSIEKEPPITNNSTDG